MTHQARMDRQNISNTNEGISWLWSAGYERNWMTKWFQSQVLQSQGCNFWDDM